MGVCTHAGMAVDQRSSALCMMIGADSAVWTELARFCVHPARLFHENLHSKCVPLNNLCLLGVDVDSIVSHCEVETTIVSHDEYMFCYSCFFGHQQMCFEV